MTDAGLTEEDEARLKQLLEETQTDQLEPLAPDDAVEQYLDSRTDLKPASVRTTRSSLGFFLDWCEKEDIENLNGLSGRDISQYRHWRCKEAPVKVDRLAPKTEKAQMDILRGFIRWCESVDAVPERLHERVLSPSMSESDEVRDEILESDRAGAILDWLTNYEYATTEHVTWALLSKIGLRIGSVRALDLRDYRPSADDPHLDINHRPETGTPLKNGGDGERKVYLPPKLVETLDDYIADRRYDKTDDAGREPLLTTKYGRLTASAIRKYVYKWSRPCMIGNECPHGRDPDTCEAQPTLSASKCPSSVSPHPIRRGYITAQLRNDVPVEILTDRCNVSEAVLKKHYDERTSKERMEHRARILRRQSRSNGSYADD